MRATMFTAIGAILWTLTLQADETLPVLEVKGQVYSNATVFKVTDTDIYFSSRQGLGNAKLKDLAPELQKHFRYDSAKADAMEQKQAAATAQYHSQIINQPSDSVTELSWGVDLPAALNRARSENKIVLLDFTGSDWCPWCIKFDQEVLSTGKFANYAGRKLELVEVDFPNTKAQSDLLKHDNAELKQRFNVSGFPTYVLLNSDGKELGRQVGYRAGGPDAFIAELGNFSKR